MTLDEIKLKADKFFEWPSKERDHVTTTSCLLFARECVEEELEEVTLHNANFGLQAARIEQQGGEITRLQVENAELQILRTLNDSEIATHREVGRLAGMEEAAKIVDGYIGCDQIAAIIRKAAVRAKEGVWI
jgi:hypothetical protein